MRAGPLVVLVLVPLLAGCAVPGLAPRAPLAEALACTAFEPLDLLTPAPPALPVTPPLPLPVAVPSPQAPSAPRLAPPTIERDEWGVPVLRPESTTQLWHEIGYAMAQDRLWQLEHKRLAMQGRLSEVHGASKLESDALARERRFGAGEIEGALAALEPDTREALDAYVAGINLRLDEVLRDPTKRPAELVAYAWTPAPWRPQDVVEVMLQDAALGMEGRTAQVAYALLDALPEDEALAALGDLVPIGTVEGVPTSILADELRYAPAALPTSWHAGQLAALREARGLFEPATVKKLDPLPLGGSNAIVVAPERSASGGALLLGGPQVGYETPAVYWEVRVETADATWNAFLKPGEGLPRGHLGAVSFVLTTGYGDQHDLVLLELDPADPERYLYGGESRAFSTREEVFVVADRDAVPPVAPQAERRTARASHMGPVVAHDAEVGWALVEQRLAPRGQVAYLDAFLDERVLATTADPVAARAAVAELSTRVAESTNIIAAYADGVIELRHTGRPVVRPGGQDHRLPRLGEPASEPTQRWAASCLPAVVSPERGYVANWNNAPAPGWTDVVARPWMWGPSHRLAVLDAHLREAMDTGPVDVDDLNEAMRRAATQDAYAWRILPALLDGLDDARAQPLRDWLDAGTPMVDADQDGDVDHPGLAAYEGWRRSLQDEVFGDELGEANRRLLWAEDLDGSNYDDHGRSNWTEGVMVALLEGETSRDWWDDLRTPERETMRDILARTLDDVRPEERQMTRTLYKRTGMGPELAMPQTNRGSINYLVDYGTGRVATVVTPGESGHVAVGGEPDAHVADQLDLYVAFAYKER